MMLQASKVLKSRDDWKEKAVRRAYKIREFKKSQTRHLKIITELKQANEDKKNIPAITKTTDRNCKNG